MLVLDVSTDLGPAATLAELEEVIRSLRIAADVAYDAEVQRVRRTVTRRMKYPTNSELVSARDRFPEGDEEGPRYRARRQLAARDFLRREGSELPYDIPFVDQSWRRKTGLPSFQALSDTGYDRLIATGFPFAGTAGGLFIHRIFGFLRSETLADGRTESSPQFHRQR